MQRACSPATQRQQDRMQLAPPIGKLVQRATGVAPLDDTRAFELAQPLRQHIRTRAECGSQIGESFRSVQELADDEQRPALPNHVESPRDTTGVAVAAQTCHWGDLVTCIKELSDPKVGLTTRQDRS